jgi:transposase
MVCGYSRWLSAVMIPSRQGPDLLAGHWQLITGWGSAPQALVWDNESAIGGWQAGRPRLTEATNAFRGTLGIKVVLCRPRDPEAKGLVERANGYLETSFLPGRRFNCPADFNTQLQDWLARANQRHHRRLGCRPVDRWQADRAAMVPLPPIAPQTGWRTSLRLPRDHYVRVAGNDYSVDPGVVGRRVDVVADLDRVQVLCQGRQVADHERCWAAHQTITDPGHRKAAAALRVSARSGRQPASQTGQVQQRRLGDYDRIFGLDQAEAVA